MLAKCLISSKWLQAYINYFTAAGHINEPSHLELCCLTLSLSTLHINVFPNDSLLKKKKEKKQTTNVVWNLAPKELTQCAVS